ncbi:MAG: hypothetical protein HW419_2036 [Deltaproteobacteria bacterium]|nr:hypothetical protein [Deltaproteobacteria bacterium]
MKLSAELLALLFIVLVSSSCAALSRSGDHTPEPINWREYADC